LRPLTCNTPKPMLPLLEKPVLEYNIELLRQHGIREIAITVQYMSTTIKQYFGDGSKWGVNLYYFEDSPPLITTNVSSKNCSACFLMSSLVCANFKIYFVFTALFRVMRGIASRITQGFAKVM
ncbi:sugar phosphate nucleotidyltransferase, partial [Escherichia sp. SP-MK]